MTKTIGNTISSVSPKTVQDITTFGDEHTWKILYSQSSEHYCWSVHTSAMEIPLVGCCVKSTTLRNSLVSESITFVPNTEIEDIMNEDGTLYGRRLAYAVYDGKDKILNG